MKALTSQPGDGRFSVREQKCVQKCIDLVSKAAQSLKPPHPEFEMQKLILVAAHCGDLKFNQAVSDSGIQMNGSQGLSA